MIDGVKISIITSLYRSSKYLEEFFKNYLDISNLNCVELVIIHNDPTFEEKKIIDEYSNRIPKLTYKIVPREPIYTSWNRAIKLSNGRYIAMWNVDDRRTSDSLNQQSIILNENPDCMIVTGDYYKVFNYGDTNGFFKKDRVDKHLINNVLKFNNGCFLMWKKSVHEEVGYFDEQFMVSGDWEFWARVTSKYKVLRTDTLLGYYLRKSDEGISKKKRGKILVEHEIINLRYYTFYAINIYSLFFNKNICISEILNYGHSKTLIIKKSYFLSCLPSIVLFWIPAFKKLVVKVLFSIREFRSSIKLNTKMS